MARIFITGSAGGLGSMAAQSLIDHGHQVVLHARNSERARAALQKAPKAEKVLTADLADMPAVKDLAAQVNALGQFDAVIHNAAVSSVSNEEIFEINSLAPYILTCLITRPKRLIYLSSGMHAGGRVDLENITHNTNYSDSKLQIILLTKAVARRWPAVYVNAVNPGWVPTKMGGQGAPDDLQKGYETQVWLATSDDPGAKVSGRYFFHLREVNSAAAADDVALQDGFLERCREISGVELPSR